ncbi:hypothetical protein PSTT_04342, partial [Puccinia striiformis]
QAAASDNDIEINESQSDIAMATPSISQATSDLTKQPTNTENKSNQPSKKLKQTSNIWDHFTKKGTGTYYITLLSSSPDNGIMQSCNGAMQ